MSIGEQIKRHRKLQGLKQRELADLAGITVPTYQFIERDMGNPSINNYRKVAEALGLDLSILLKEKEAAKV